MKRKKKKDYLSRKRSSLKEKTLMDRFNELYDGLKEVKEHRYQEKLQELQDEMFKPIKASNNTKNEHTKVLLQQQSTFFRKKDYTEKKLSCLFTMDQYYMRDMLLKKMNDMIEDHNGELGSSPINRDNRNNDNDNDDDDRNIKKKNLQRKQSSNKNKMISPKKAKAPGIAVPKKRKSRRIRDSEV